MFTVDQVKNGFIVRTKVVEEGKENWEWKSEDFVYFTFEEVIHHLRIKYGTS